MSVEAATARRLSEGDSHARGQVLEPAEVAWLAVLPCAVIVTLEIVLLGPPLGHALLEPAGDHFWPQAEVVPEPVEHGRFVLALLGAPLLAAVVAASRRRPFVVRPALARAGITAARAATITLLAIALLAQHNVLFRSYIPPVWPEQIFNVATIVVSAALAVAIGALLPRREIVARLARLVRETRARRVVSALIAVALVANWLQPAFNTETTAGQAMGSNLIWWDMAETFAVLDGRTPLVDYHSQYAQLLPYVAAIPLAVLGASMGVWTATMIVCSAIGMLAIRAVLRRVTGSSVLALVLFAPFLAVSAMLVGGDLRSTQQFSIWPMRYAAPYVLLWLTARHLDGAHPRRRIPLVLAGSLVAINNVEFGLPALGATLAAVLWANPPRSRRAAARLAGETAGGLLGAVALVALVSLARTGQLPDLVLLLEFPRLYGVDGWVLERMAAFGFHLAVYATFVATIGVATVRAARGDDDRLLTGLLVWSGVFGLGASSYFAGRSDTLSLIALFSAWGLALVLLVIVVGRRLIGRDRPPTAPELAVLFGCGLMVCALAQVPLPWNEASRLERTTEPVFVQSAAVRFVSDTTEPGERVAIITPLGHRLAYDAGVVNVAPYASTESMPTEEQLETTLAAIRREGAERLYLGVIYGEQIVYQGQFDAITAAGWAIADQRGDYVMLTNAQPSR